DALPITAATGESDVYRGRGLIVRNRVAEPIDGTDMRQICFCRLRAIVISPASGDSAEPQEGLGVTGPDERAAGRGCKSFKPARGPLAPVLIGARDRLIESSRRWVQSPSDPANGRFQGSLY